MGGVFLYTPFPPRFNYPANVVFSAFCCQGDVYSKNSSEIGTFSRRNDAKKRLPWTTILQEFQAPILLIKMTLKRPPLRPNSLVFCGMKSLLVLVLVSLANAANDTMAPRSLDKYSLGAVNSSSFRGFEHI